MKTLEDYPPEQRSMLMKAVGAAVKATRAETDRAFEDWLSRQMADQ